MRKWNQIPTNIQVRFYMAQVVGNHGKERKSSNPNLGRRQSKKDDFEVIGELAFVSAQIVLNCVYLVGIWSALHCVDD